MHPFLRTSGFLFCLLVAGCLAFSATAATFPWPDSRTHPRVILTADQTIVDYMKEHPDWFRSDFLIAGFYIDEVQYGNSDEASAKFSYYYNQFKMRNIITGSYISGTTAIHELDLTTYPANAASVEDMSFRVHYLTPWIREPQQLRVDLKDPKSRNELQFDIRELWLHIPVIMRFIDNAAVHPRVLAGMLPWRLYCENMAVLRAGAEAGHAQAIFNVFARPWELSNEDMIGLITAVAGNGGNAISFPLPWSKAIKDDKNAIAWAVYRYRQLLNYHIVVILVPSEDAPATDLYTWVSTWRRPGDRVYIATPFYDIPPGPY